MGDEEREERREGENMEWGQQKQNHQNLLRTTLATHSA